MGKVNHNRLLLFQVRQQCKCDLLVPFWSSWTWRIFEITEAGYETIWWTGLTLFGVFNIVAVLVAVNMLIAILNESYTRISVSKKPFSRSLLNRRSLGHHAMLLVLSSRFFGRTQRTAVYGLVLATMTIRKQSILFRTATSRAVEPRYNEPLYNEGYSTP